MSPKLAAHAVFSGPSIASAPKPKRVRWSRRASAKLSRPLDVRAIAAAQGSEWWRGQS